jgi:hypothetical protein
VSVVLTIGERIVSHMWMEWKDIPKEYRCIEPIKNAPDNRSGSFGHCRGLYFLSLFLII